MFVITIANQFSGKNFPLESGALVGPDAINPAPVTSLIARIPKRSLSAQISRPKAI